jgi:hypothetical protein
VARQGRTLVVGNVGMYYAAYRLSLAECLLRANNRHRLCKVKGIDGTERGDSVGARIRTTDFDTVRRILTTALNRDSA